MALAHQAAEGRLLALFDIKAIRNAVRKSGWRYVWLFLTTLFFTLPLFASRGLVTFASGIFGDVETMSPEQIQNIRDIWGFITAGYVFTSLWILRTLAARLYVRAINRESRSFAPFRLIRFSIIVAAGLAFTLMIVFGQFMNHSYWVWLNHPYMFLPWWG